jgi:hypothetical protein
MGWRTRRDSRPEKAKPTCSSRATGLGHHFLPGPVSYHLLLHKLLIVPQRQRSKDLVEGRWWSQDPVSGSWLFCDGSAWQPWQAPSVNSPRH